MNTYAITYRAGGDLRMCPVQAASMAAAWICAFDVIEALGVPVAGFGVRLVGAGA
ncbi:hypothetical protein [Acidovorax sp. Leaf160]|uniref:hypothetical protein n=1 Tax=Acidovorax sp. Leaf160 TaxID=1736280 RepID=UPI000AD69F57|nr:hypothetical protein [Acidovorax sp. Leaf160]